MVENVELTDSTDRRNSNLKRLALDSEYLLGLPPEQYLAEFHIKNRLRSAGFDLDKPYESYHDVVNNEYVYSQKEDEDVSTV